MKFIIRNRVYDTTSSVLIGAKTTGAFDEKITEELYRKSNGEYWLFGMGGKNTRYAKNLHDGFFTKGEKAMPLRYEHAMLWAKENLPGTVYRDEFEKDRYQFTYDKSNTERISALIPKSLADELDYRVSALKQKKTDIVIDALAQYFRINPVSLDLIDEEEIEE